VGGAAGVDLETAADDPYVLLGVLELWRATGGDSFLGPAARIAENLVTKRFHKGFFVRSAEHVFAQVGAIEPLALLRFAAAAQGELGSVPAAWPADPYFQAPHDGLGRSRDIEVIYGRKR
jgi:pectate lyase